VILGFGLVILGSVRKAGVAKVSRKLSPNADQLLCFFLRKAVESGVHYSVPGRCFNTEPSTDHSVLQGRKRGSHHYRRSGESRKTPL
jgi:hypothetical protein